MKKIENIFIWTSIIFLIGIVGFFSYRFIHYYRLSHNRDVISNDLYEIILDNRAILNLRKVDNSYYYTENNGNNYVIYSGILWRIIKLENNKLTLISDVPVTNLYYDDVLILCILFFLYNEKVNDPYLFFTLVLLLLT